MAEQRLPEDVAAYDDAAAEVWVGEPKPLAGRIEIVEYDPAWPDLFEQEAQKVRAALAERVVRLEHTSSTSVPGLPAKRIIDMVLEVPDSSDEPGYAPDLEAAGYMLQIRDPDWFEHRLFKGAEPNANLHVFSAGCEETDNVLLFRDWLRARDADRDLYANAKRELAARDWKWMQQYADAKSEVIAEIMARARAAR